MAKGFDVQNERVYLVQELASMEVVKGVMASPEAQERIKEAGVDMA